MPSRKTRDAKIKNKTLGQVIEIYDVPDVGQQQHVKIHDITPNAKNEYGHTKLYHAVCNNDLKYVYRLIEEGADINMLVNGCSALHIALGLRHYKIAQFLINSGARIVDQSSQPICDVSKDWLIGQCEAGTITTAQGKIQIAEFIKVSLNNGDIDLAEYNDYWRKLGSQSDDMERFISGEAFEIIEIME